MRALQLVKSLSLMALVSVGFTGCTGQTPAPESRRPNILVAMADDWSYPNAGAYGDRAVMTPAIDALAQNGVLFEHAYVSSPSCTPSRAAILSGQFHWRLRESASLWSTLSADIPVYPDLLEEAGYFVGYSGKGWGPGRDEEGGRKRNPAGNRFDHFFRFLEERPQGQPFCFWFGTSDPHRPYQEGDGGIAGIDLQAITVPPHLPDHPTVRADLADYLSEVERFDRAIARMLRRLDEIGEADNTIVVVSGDNGMPFPRCKSNLYDCGTRVPLVIRWPRRAAGGRIVSGFVSTTDLAPTILEAAGVPVPAVMTGRSLVPLLIGVEDAGGDRDAVLTGKERHVPGQEGTDSGGTPMRAIRTQDYLYIRNFRPDRWPAGTPNYLDAYLQGSWYADVDNGPTKTLMVRQSSEGETWARFFELAFARRPGEELYDLGKDPGQLVNVAADPAYGSVRADLARRLEQVLQQTGDPRLGPDPDQFDRYPYYGGSPRHPDFVAPELDLR